MVREPLPDPKRKRLEKLFEVASKKMATAASPTDFDYVADLLLQCAAGDPGNVDYVSNYIESLQKKYGNVKKVGAWRNSRNAAPAAPLKKPSPRSSGTKSS